MDVLHRHAGFPGPRNQEVDRGDRARERRAALIRREPSRVRRGPWWRHALCPTNSRRGGCKHNMFGTMFFSSNVWCFFRKNSKARSCTLGITRRPGITKGKRWRWSTPAPLVRCPSINLPWIPFHFRPQTIGHDIAKDLHDHGVGMFLVLLHLLFVGPGDQRIPQM